MKIKTRLYLSSISSILLVTALIFIIFLNSNEISKANKRRAASRSTLQAISELDILAHDYAMYHQKRAQEQWWLRYGSLKPLIAAAAAEAAAEEEEEEEEEGKMLVSRLSVNSDRLGDFFSKAVASYEKKQKLIQEGASQDKIEVVGELENRLIAQFFVASQSMISDASRLAEKNVADLLKAQSLARNYTLFIALVLLLISIITAFAVARVIAVSLHKLHKGADIVATGNLDYKLGMKSQDEVGQVSLAFDRMTESLKKITASRDALDKEIVERKKAEEMLHKSEAWLSATLKSAGDGMIVTDIQGKVVSINPIAEALTGWKQEEAKGLPLKNIFHIVNEETGKEVDDPVAGAIREGAIVGLGNHTLLIAKDGTRRPIDDSAAPIKDAKGDFVGVVLIFRDVTERRKQEKKLQEAMKAKSAFTSMVSHELRTPLAALKESVSQVQEGILGEINVEQKRFLGIAKGNVDRLARLINEVLDFQTLETGKAVFKMEDNDINGVIKEVRETMLPIAEKKGLDFILELDENLPKMRFDRDKIIQVLSNLLSNSLKLTEKGNITISTTQGDNVIQVSVKDTGPGIKEEDMPRLFQEYEQLERKAGSTGLGLAISQKIIHAHGGKIWAELAFGQGTTMHFVLPIKERRR